MKFGEVGVAEAQGAFLAHSLTLPGRTLPKGSRIDAAAQAALTEAGILTVTVATLEPGDVEENEAARQVGQAIAAFQISATPAHAGRCNLASAFAGLVRVDAARLTALNGLYEGLTVATVADATRAGPGTPVATIKIIPYALPGAVLDRALALIRREPPLAVRPFRPLRVGLVVSEVEGGRDQIARKAADVTRRRVRALTGTLLPVARTPHAAGPIAQALLALRDQGAELLLIAGGAAVTDRADVAPSAIVAAGGAIAHFGMPVDPGNLMCLGRIGAVPAIVLPSCARSIRPNGIDLILSRLFAGEEVGAPEIAAFGAGGLLTGPAACDSAPEGKRVVALVLAAGLSRRMHPWNKLLLRDAAGRSVLGRTVDSALASEASRTIVVLGHEAGPLREELAGRDVLVVEATDHAEGLSASLRAGLRAVPPGTDAVLVCLADMPLITPALLNRIIAAHDPPSGRLIVVPQYQGRRGNPVLWDARYIPELSALTGDTGGRAVLSGHAGQTLLLPLDDAAILTDLDTREDAAALSVAP